VKVAVYTIAKNETSFVNRWFNSANEADSLHILDTGSDDSTITAARDLGIEVREKRITRDEVYCADEAFFTGTAAEITPIREVDDRTIGSGRRGPITEQLQNVFFDIVGGRAQRYANWLTPVA
jgi:branched-chain amino acid aminotransferase